jgi:hypothetical protein
MLRTEMLRAKSLHTEVAYLAEMRGVREAQQVAANQRSLVTHREKAFWAEAVREQHTVETNLASAGARITFGLERLRQALGEMKEAKVHQAAVAEALQQKIGAVSKTKQRIELLQGMVARSVRLHRVAQDSRLADEVADVATIASNKHPRISVGRCDEETLATNGAAERSELPIAAPLSEGCLNFPLQVRIEAVALANESRLAPVAVRSLQHTIEPHRSSLSVTCSVGNLGSIGLRLVQGEGDGVHATVDPAIGILAGRVAAEKSAIMSRLQGLGLKLSSLEIATAEDAGDTAHGMRRSRPVRVGDEYEDDLA